MRIWSLFFRLFLRNQIKAFREKWFMLLLFIYRLLSLTKYLFCGSLQNYNTCFALIHWLIGLGMDRLAELFFFVLFTLRLSKLHRCIFTGHTHNVFSRLSRNISHSIGLLVANNYWIVVLSRCIEEILVWLARISERIFPVILVS
jgi:hypothetical protein